ncbi:MAG: glucosyltransferase domain-containing protein [Acetatifactor sp.]|nr:glucosyltransferase domain-containing protein [Acetatifactor sp.]
MNITKRAWVSFFSAFVVGLLVHLPAFLSDIPNHDGLASMYFDQDMITSGRWFLTVACGISSYFTVPWVIGLLSLLYLGISAALLTNVLEIKDMWLAGLISGLLVVFPSLCSTAAYVFTMDGYMMGVLFSILSVYLTKKYKRGFIAGGIFLALSMAIYQAYLPMAVLLCLYEVITILCDRKTGKDLKKILAYPVMGVFGIVIYYAVLRLLLLIRGLSLNTYQGIDNMSSGAGEGSLFSTIALMYRNFFAFTLKGRVLANNTFSWVSLAVLLAGAVYAFLKVLKGASLGKKVIFCVSALGILIILPVIFEMILIVSPGVEFHLLMRYHWILIPILLLALYDRYAESDTLGLIFRWSSFIAAFVLIFNYFVTDNIAYSNLQKRYEKTYAYCVRLLDRIEQTKGYYSGIPVAMIGVVSDEEFPKTDITEDVTSSMIGISGDVLLYTPANYEAFMKNYLGATINFMEVEEVTPIYYTEEYTEMDSFPGPDSTKVVDGVLYVKTENKIKD